MARRRKKVVKEEVSDYELSPAEMEVVKKWGERTEGKANARLKVVKDATGSVKIKVDHPDDDVGFFLLLDALGTADADFQNSILLQLARAANTETGEIDETTLNFILSVIKSVGPKDHIETMLACQMGAIHLATMKCGFFLSRADNIRELDSAGSMFNKLAKTFVTQMEGLKRYRTGGEQKVLVQHVSVGEGGQAIVGNVTQAARENAPDNKAASAPALAHDKTAPMPTIDGSSKAQPAPIRRKRRT